MNDLIKIIATIIATGGGIILVDIVRNTYKKRNNNKEYNGIERRRSMIDLAGEIHDLRSEFNSKINTLSDKVDSWANKLLEHYSTKRDVDKIRDKLQEVDNKISCVEKVSENNKESINILFEKINKD